LTSYVKTTWTDRIVQKPLTYTQQNNGDGTTTLIPAEGTITQSGTPITASALNNMEQGIANAFDANTGGDVTGRITCHLESHFSNGAYTDPRVGTGAAIKASGGIASDNFYIGDSKCFVSRDVNSGTLFAPAAGEGRYVFYVDGGNYFTLDDALGVIGIWGGLVRLLFHTGDPTFRMEKFDGTGANLVVGTVNGSSDRTLKKNIGEFKETALDHINATKIYDYHFKGENESERKKIGIMADEAPPCVVGYEGKNIDMYSMISVAWKAIQELTEKINVLESKIAELSADG